VPASPDLCRINYECDHAAGILPRAEPAAKPLRLVEDKTNRKIQDLIKPDTLNAVTRLVLVNAFFSKETGRPV